MAPQQSTSTPQSRRDPSPPASQGRLVLLLAGAFVLVLGALLAFSALRGDDDSAPTATDPGASGSGGDSPLVREDSRVIGEPGSTDVEFVEFLDFECEGCAAAYPFVEQLREEYAGRVTFVARYFPLDGHFNAERAARAVESAARQGRFEQMYQLMYETQPQWGEQQRPMDDLFRQFARQLGLDMATYDADYASPEVAERVQRDVRDGERLGVEGTPTFYVDGELLRPQTVDDFTEALDAALADE